MRPGLGYTAAAIVLAAATAIVVLSTATEVLTFVRQLMLAMLLVFVACLLFGFSKAMTSATVPLLGAIMIEAGFADEPSWIRSLAIGCLWFVTVEMAWEALARRDGSVRTRAAIARRVEEVTTVLGIALGVGIVAVVATEVAPARTVLVQALVLGLVLASFLMLIRRIAVTQSTATPSHPSRLD